MTIEAYAKINLTLDVLGKRSDGYHDLSSIVCPVTLSDTVTIEPSDTVSSDTGYSDDLCVQSARALGVGAAIHVVKRIPAGGGLGGGSADAAAVLIALDAMHGLGLGYNALASLGAGVGSDVPALVLANALSSPVVMEGRGEKVRAIAGRRLDFVLVFPGVHSSTKEIFSRWSDRGAGRKVGFSSTAEAKEAILSGDIARLASAVSNDLEEAAVSIHPEIGGALDALRSEDVLASSMTGSGSSVFALVSSSAKAAEIVSRLKRKGFNALAVTSL